MHGISVFMQHNSWRSHFHTKLNSLGTELVVAGGDAPGRRPEVPLVFLVGVEVKHVSFRGAVLVPLFLAVALDTEKKQQNCQDTSSKLSRIFPMSHFSFHFTVEKLLLRTSHLQCESIPNQIIRKLPAKFTAARSFNSLLRNLGLSSTTHLQYLQ